MNGANRQHQARQRRRPPHQFRVQQHTVGTHQAHRVMAVVKTAFSEYLQPIVQLVLVGSMVESHIQRIAPIVQRIDGPPVAIAKIGQADIVHKRVMKNENSRPLRTCDDLLVNQHTVGGHPSRFKVARRRRFNVNVHHIVELVFDRTELDLDGTPSQRANAVNDGRIVRDFELVRKLDVGDERTPIVG